MLKLGKEQDPNDTTLAELNLKPKQVIMMVGTPEANLLKEPAVESSNVWLLAL